MLEINLLKNNIPNKINIPKKSKLSFVKFLTIIVLVILVFCFAIFAGFYLAKKETHRQISLLKTHAKTNIVERKEKKATKTNNTFSVVVELENATLNSTKNTQLIQEKPTIQQKSVSKAKAQSQEFTPPPTQAAPKQNITQPSKTAKVIKKDCFVFSNGDSLEKLKSILGQKKINYTIEEIGKPRYYYVVYAGGLEKSEFLGFKNALKEKGYNVIGTKTVNGKYYADLGRMNESEKNKFLSAWKNLGFDISVDKQEELSNKKYKVKFSCTKDIFEELSQKGFNVKTGRGAAW